MKILWKATCLWACIATMHLGPGQAASSSSSSSSSSISLLGYGDFPNCSVGCLGALLTESSCSLTNKTCICDSVSSGPVKKKMLACVQKACSVKDALVTQNVTMTTCDFPVRDKSRPYKIIVITLVIVAGLFIIQRLTFRIFSNLGLWYDDWLILLTLVTVVSSTIVNMVGAIENGIGRDIWTLEPKKITGFMKSFYVMGIFYFLQLALLKLSLLFFYLRIFPTPITRRLLWGTIIFNALFGISFSLAAVFHCRPVHYFWHQWDGEHNGHCNDINALSLANAIISIAVDLWMLIIPLAQLKSLNLSLKRKIGVGLMFTVGTFVTVVSILRLDSVIKFAKNAQNPTWDFADMSRWSVVEINFGIICACMPAIRLLLDRLFPGIMGSTAQKGSRSELSEARSAPWRHSSHGEHVERMSTRITPPERILYQKSFTVEYSESDETQLVHMRDLETGSGKPRFEHFEQWS